MATPKIEETISGYHFLWEGAGITIGVSRVVVHNSDGRVTGELLIQSAGEDGQTITIVPQTSFTFSAPRTRQELIKILALKYPLISWAEIIDQLCYGVIDRARRGEPVQALWTSEDAPPPEWLLEPILLKGLPSVIFGEKAVAKSTMALVFYFCLLLPWQDNPLQLKVPKRSIQPLILDWETEADIIHHYAKRIQIGHQLGAIPILYRRCSLPLADDLERIQQHVTENKAEVVIIDSLGAAAGGELNNPEIGLRFFAALRRLKVTSLIIAQTNKDIKTKRKSIFGTVFFTYYARNVWELCKSELITEEEDIELAMFQRHFNIGKPYKPMSFHLHYNETGLTIERQPFDIKEFIAKVSAAQQILEYLLGVGKAKGMDIAKALNIPDGTVRPVLKQLRERGKVIKIEDEWAVLAK